MEKDWELERSPRLNPSPGELNHLVQTAFPGRTLREHSVLGAGLGNTNIRFRLDEGSSTYVLRLHQRDPAAAARERALMTRLRVGLRVPTPELVYSDPLPERGTHPYSIWTFVEGTLLQDLFHTLPPTELVNIAHACGRTLAPLHTYCFSTSGEFGPDLEILREYGAPSSFVTAEVHQRLFGGLAGKRLGAELRDELWAVVEKASPVLREIDGHYTLVHCDYKRSNLLMTQTASTWSVAAVLDWEYACTGPPLIDFGLFLRAGSQLPAGFSEAFAAGYVDAGGELPSEWLRCSRLLDLLSQMTFLDDPRDRPRVVEETIDVVKETIRIVG